MGHDLFDIEKASVFLSPNKTILGKNTIQQTGQEIAILGGSKVLIVTDKGVANAGLADPVISSLKAAGVKAGIYEKVIPEPPSYVVDDVSKLARKDGYDAIIGVGGGSALDVAKGASMMASNPGKILDYVGVNQFKTRGLPKILIPTTAGTGSEATWVCVATDERENTKKSLYSNMLLPDTAILDPVMTVSMPPSVTADTGFDALVHAIESYVSVNRTPYTAIMAKTAIELIARNLPVAYAKGGDLRARYSMLLAANLAGMAFTSGGLGATHGLAYPLGTEYHMAHGRSNAIMLPHVMDFNRSASTERYAAIAAMMGERIEGLGIYDAAARSVEAVKKLLATVNISCRLSDHGIKKGSIGKLAKEAEKQARFFVPNPKDLTPNDIKGIYEKAF